MTTPLSAIVGIPTLLLKLWRHLGRRRQRQFGLLLVLMVISAFAEVLSLGSVLPFLGILMSPERLFNHPMLAGVVRAWGIGSAEQLVLPLTLLFVAMALVAGGIRIFLLWVSTRFTVASGADLSIEAYRRTLYQPYQVHVARNSSSVISSITTKVNGTVYGVLLQLLLLISAMVLLVAVTSALIAIDPKVASVAIVGFGSSYGLISLMSRRRLLRNSQRIAHEQVQVVKALQEGLGGIRDVLLDGTQSVYCDVYHRADNLLRRAEGGIFFISGSPRFAMEAFGTVLIAVLAYGLNYQEGGIAAAVPVLGSLALGAQRLLPALQQCYSAWASITGYRSSLSDTIELLDQPMPLEMIEGAPEPLPFKREIKFEGLRFKYSDDGPWVLNGLDFGIFKGTRVGIVGSTGSGKSTMLDLLMGLLVPTEGCLSVDGRQITGVSLRAWQRSIAHVPQSIYLADTTLAENIAFGVSANEIDMDKVRSAARQAQIADFIEGQPDGYGVLVGERGVRLSGGQRQRIGIARALYKQASVLVFDEATSALDNATEQSVMSAIEGLDRDLTILLVAHRLTTVRHCDLIIVLEQGRVAAQGSYAELLENSASFRKIARAAG